MDKNTQDTWDIVFRVLSYLILILSFIGGMILQKQREKSDRKSKHLSLIKKEVLEPLLHVIESKYEPIFERKHPPIHIGSHPIMEGRGIDEKRVGTEYYFELPEGQLTTDFSILTKDLLKSVNPYLYEDLRNHNRQLYTETAEFMSQFREFTQMCEKEAQTILQELIDEYDFPARLMDEDEMRFHTHEFARAILKKRMGFDISLKRSHSGEHYQVTAHDYLIAEKAWELTLVSIDKAFEDLSQPTEASQKLTEEADRILSVVRGLKEGLYNLISSEKLKGNCSYI